MVDDTCFCCLGAVLFLAVFLLVETRVRELLIPLHLFGIRVFSAANLITLVLSFATVGPVFFLAQYFQQVQGYTVLEAGLCTLPISVGAFLTAPLAGGLAGRIGSRPPIVLGGLLYGGALLLLMRLEPDSSYASFWWILGMMGIGFGFRHRAFHQVHHLTKTPFLTEEVAVRVEAKAVAAARAPR